MEKLRRSLAIGAERQVRVGGSIMRWEESKRKNSEDLAVPHFLKQGFIALPQIVEVQFSFFRWLGVCQVNDFNPEITQGDNIKMYLYKLKLEY